MPRFFSASVEYSSVHVIHEMLDIVFGLERIDEIIACQEGISNAQREAIKNKSTIDIVIQKYDNYIHVAISNVGEFCPDKYMELPEPEIEAESGRGIWIMRQIAYDLFYDCHMGITTLHLFFKAV